jgi:hypothetical protein
LFFVHRGDVSWGRLAKQLLHFPLEQTVLDLNLGIIIHVIN